MCDGVVDPPAARHVAHIVSTDYEAADLKKETSHLTRYHLQHCTAEHSLTCWSFSSLFLAWMMNPLKVELSVVVSFTVIFSPGATRSELRVRLAGEVSCGCGAWLCPGVTATIQYSPVFSVFSSQNKTQRLTLTSRVWSSHGEH